MNAARLTESRRDILLQTEMTGQIVAHWCLIRIMGDRAFVRGRDLYQA
jgi:hypothetical protein